MRLLGFAVAMTFCIAGCSKIMGPGKDAGGEDVLDAAVEEGIWTDDGAAADDGVSADDATTAGDIASTEDIAPTEEVSGDVEVLPSTVRQFGWFGPGAVLGDKEGKVKGFGSLSGPQQALKVK